MKQWEKEPDEKYFEHVGYKCALKRGPLGHWCGYVGIPENHPWFGKGYDAQVKVPKKVIERPIDVDKVGVINVFCAVGKSDALEAGFMDIVLAVDVHGGLTYAGERDGLWWFGFDCAHSGDLSPKYESLGTGGTYRDMEYVEQECKNLAEQLRRFEIREAA